MRVAASGIEGVSICDTWKDGIPTNRRRFLCRVKMPGQATYVARRFKTEGEARAWGTGKLAALEASLVVVRDEHGIRSPPRDGKFSPRPRRPRQLSLDERDVIEALAMAALTTAQYWYAPRNDAEALQRIERARTEAELLCPTELFARRLVNDGASDESLAHHWDNNKNVYWTSYACNKHKVYGMATARWASMRFHAEVNRAATERRRSMWRQERIISEMGLNSKASKSRMQRSRNARRGQLEEVL